MSAIRVALAQINPVVGRLRYNTEKVLSFVEKAKRARADLVSFPELGICGYPPGGLLLKESFIEDSLKALNHIVRNVSGIIVILGCLDKDEENNIYNSAAVIKNGKLITCCHKSELSVCGGFDEKIYFKKGAGTCIFSLNGIPFGVNICKGGLAEEQCRKGAKLIFQISASAYNMDETGLRRRSIKKEAKKSNLHVCFNNMVGGQDELVFDGGSFVLDSKGREVACAKQFEEALVVCDLDIEPLIRKRKDCVNLGNLKTVRKPAISSGKFRQLDHAAEIYSVLVLGTGDYIRKNGFRKAVVGLSGGIDSSLTALVACDALGNKNLVGVSMPSQYSSCETQKDAEILAKNLGIKFIRIPINDMFESYLTGLRREFQGRKVDTAEENIQARIRGSILMSLSNKFGWLVLATGNKSEISCGYCTLYGDLAGGFSVLGDVYKTRVYELAEFRNREDKIIPESVFVRAPTAELRPGQADRDSLPPYPVLDEILKCYLEDRKSCREITEDRRFSSRTVARVINMVNKSEYKRRQSPAGVNIVPGQPGERMPITNGYHIGEKNGIR